LAVSVVIFTAGLFYAAYQATVMVQLEYPVREGYEQTVAEAFDDPYIDTILSYAVWLQVLANFYMTTGYGTGFGLLRGKMHGIHI
jgi:hypothetical protein